MRQCQRPGCSKLVHGDNRYCSKECRRTVTNSDRRALREAIQSGKKRCPLCGHKGHKE